MKILICLAMSCGLTAILYFYLKQRLGVIETRLNTLTDLAQTLATELYQKEKQQLENVPVLQNESSDSESDSENDSESESCSDSTDSECESENESMPALINEDVNFPIELKEVKIEPELKIKLEPELNEVKQIPIEIPIELVTEPIVVYKTDSLPETLIEVSDDESVKQVALDEYSKLSLKELKQKVNDLGGPPLKTKQALINFLKKKV
jgi:hypothetical protein